MNNKKVLNEIKDAKGIVTATKLFEGQPTLLCEASSLGIPSFFQELVEYQNFFHNLINIHLSNLTMMI